MSKTWIFLFWVLVYDLVIWPLQLWRSQFSQLRILKLTIKTIAFTLAVLALQIGGPVQEVQLNVVDVAVYIEAQCSDTSRFVHKQLLPTWEKLADTNRMKLMVVPFGKARCQPRGDDYQ